MVFLPWSNMSLTLLAPTPTNISTKSEPEIEKKGTFASPAIALASNVFPVPGGPTSKALGILPPSLENFCGSFANSTTSSNSCFASSIQLHHQKELPTASFRSLAFDFPKPIALPPPDCICRIRKSRPQLIVTLKP